MKTVLFLCILVTHLMSAPAAANETSSITIAAVFAKTGVANLMDFQHFRGVSLAVDEINEHGGLLGKRVEVVELDNQSSALAAKHAAQEAINLGVTAVIGASWSAHSLAMAPLLEEAGIPMISPLSTNPELTLKGEYVFRVCFTDTFQGKVMAHFAYRDLGARTAMVLKNVSGVYSMDLGEFFAGTFTELGGRILGEGKYKEKDLDFSEILAEVQSKNPQIVFVPGYIRDSALIMKQAANLGIRTLFLGADGWSNKMYELAGSAIDGQYYCTHWHPGVSFPQSLKLLKSYDGKYHTELQDSFAPMAYDAVMVLADAIKRSGVLDRRKIRDALSETTGFQGATGTITFDENGDPVNKDAVILRFQSQTSAFVKVITPAVAAKDPTVSPDEDKKTATSAERQHIEEKE